MPIMKRTPPAPARSPASAIFQAYDAALELENALRGPLGALRWSDPALAERAKHAVRSVAENVAEGARHLGYERVRLFSVAAGSAAGARSSLDAACTAGQLDARSLGRGLELIEHLIAMLWDLMHPENRRWVG